MGNAAVMQDVEMEWVKLKDTPPGHEWTGFYGGKFINKFGMGSVALYSPSQGGGFKCTCLALSAGLRKKFPLDAGRVAIRYLGLVQSGKFQMHDFEIDNIPTPKDNPKAQQFMAKLQAHTDSMSTALYQPPEAFPENPWANNNAESDLPF